MITIEIDKLMTSLNSPIGNRRRPVTFTCPECLTVETFYVMHNSVCKSCGATFPNIEDCVFTPAARLAYHRGKK